MSSRSSAEDRFFPRLSMAGTFPAGTGRQEGAVASASGCCAGPAACRPGTGALLPRPPRTCGRRPVLVVVLVLGAAQLALVLLGGVGAGGLLLGRLGRLARPAGLLLPAGHHRSAPLRSAPGGQRAVRGRGRDPQPTPEAEAGRLQTQPGLRSAEAARWGGLGSRPAPQITLFPGRLGPRVPHHPGRSAQTPPLRPDVPAAEPRAPRGDAETLTTR